MLNDDMGRRSCTSRSTGVILLWKDLSPVQTLLRVEYVGFMTSESERRDDRMKASVDSNLCSAAGRCVEICPEVFEFGANTAKVKLDTVPSECEDACRKAAEQCPSNAISMDM
jgi:ferredoxin